MIKNEVIKLGFNTSTAKNGYEGHFMIQKYKVDRVLTDYYMPLMNGIEFIEKAKNIISGRKITIYSHVNNIIPSEIKDHIKEFGVHGFIDPPVTLEAIKKILSRE